MLQANDIQALIDAHKLRISQLRDYQLYCDAQMRSRYNHDISESQKAIAELQTQLELTNAILDDAPDFGDGFNFDAVTIEVEQAPIFRGEGLYLDMPNDWYRAQDGVSKSDLMYLKDSECDFLWNKQAPRDEDALKTFEIGTAFHCIIFEFEQFASRYIVAPAFNRRSNQGRADELAFLDEMAGEGKIIISHEDNKKIRAMRESCYAHPKARLFLEADGIAEASIFHRDIKTGEMVKVRPDKIIQFQDRHIIIDAKSIGHFDRMAQSVEDLSYHVQDSMYSDIYEKHFGHTPEFHFLFCSTSMEIGRYPVTVRELSDDWRAEGYRVYRELLETYHEAKTNDDWLDRVSILNRPRWAK